MKIVSNECVGCDLPCFDSCPYKNVDRFYCDRCNEEETLYNYFGEELCKDCILKEFDIVEGSDSYL